MMSLDGALRARFYRLNDWRIQSAILVSSALGLCAVAAIFQTRDFAHKPGYCLGDDIANRSVDVSMYACIDSSVSLCKCAVAAMFQTRDFAHKPGYLFRSEHDVW